MNGINFEYLRNQIKYTGFGEELADELKRKMESGTSDFTLTYQAEFGSQRVEAILQFKKPDQKDQYYFNRFFLTLKNKENEPDLIQSFRIGRENNITLKEAFNLLNGRAVYKEMVSKEGVHYKAWLQINFKEIDEMGDFKMKQFHENYGFDLRQVLVRFPIKEFGTAESAKFLVRSLERGNRQLVTILHEGREKKIFIEANPQFKTLNFFNPDYSRIDLRQGSSGSSKNFTKGEGSPDLPEIHPTDSSNKARESENSLKGENGLLP
jgi:hypothetical protein